MKELISITAGKTDRYEFYADLLCKRDAYYKETRSILLSFNREFGLKVKENFELKIACIRIKKQIAFCQKRINRGRTIDVKKMEASIERDMRMYYEELREIIKYYESGRNSVAVDEWRMRQAKTIYRKLARKIHPDINQMTKDNPKLSELWNRLVRAYNRSDIEELENLEVLAARLISDLRGDFFKYSFTDIEERIARVERQIAEILSTEPYTFKRLLTEEDRKLEKHRQLDQEREEYMGYKTKLTKEFDRMIYEGGMRFIWEVS